MVNKIFSATVASAALAVIALAGGLSSGLKAGENVVPFHPKHISGPLANSDRCFPCTFQQRPQVQVWVNGDDMKNVASIAKVLDKAMATYSAKEFKALVVFVTNPQNVGKVTEMVKSASAQPGLKSVGMAVIDKDNQAVSDYKINLSGDIKNTVFVYKNWKIAKTFVNLTGDAKGLDALSGAISGIVNQ